MNDLFHCHLPSNAFLFLCLSGSRNRTKLRPELLDFFFEFEWFEYPNLNHIWTRSKARTSPDCDTLAISIVRKCWLFLPLSLSSYVYLLDELKVLLLRIYYSFHIHVCTLYIAHSVYLASAISFWLICITIYWVYRKIVKSFVFCYLWKQLIKKSLLSVTLE